MPEGTARSVSATNGNGIGRVSFSELVRAHYELDTTADGASVDALDRRFRALLQSFQASSGQIVDAYWCRKEASAVALTRRESHLLGFIERTATGSGRSRGRGFRGGGANRVEADRGVAGVVPSRSTTSSRAAM